MQLYRGYPQIRQLGDFDSFHAALRALPQDGSNQSSEIRSAVRPRPRAVYWGIVSCVRRRTSLDGLDLANSWNGNSINSTTFLALPEMKWDAPVIGPQSVGFKLAATAGFPCPRLRHRISTYSGAEPVRPPPS